MFKNKISFYITKFILNNINVSKIQLQHIDYGLNIILINIPKLILLFLISYIFNITYYFGVAFFTFATLRFFAAGMHNSTSIGCNIMNITIFFSNIFFSIYCSFDKYILIFFNILSLIIFILYAPADTKEKPIINKNLRKFLKIFSVLTSCILFILSMIIYNTNIIYSNIISISIFEEALTTTPICYKLFNKSYNNYLNYL